MATLNTMQSSKLPRKNKPAEPIAASAAPERTANPRPSRAKKAKVEESPAVLSETAQSAEESVMKHHHSVAAEQSAPTTSTSNQLTSADVQAAPVASPAFVIRQNSEVTHDMIAQLAYSYWAERGFAHGSAEQDWLRAEQHLKARAAAATA